MCVVKPNKFAIIFELYRAQTHTRTEQHLLRSQRRKNMTKESATSSSIGGTKYPSIMERNKNFIHHNQQFVFSFFRATIFWMLFLLLFHRYHHPELCAGEIIFLSSQR